MKIVQITPGSGDNFYCENCLRDAALVKAMRNLGHDVLMVPLYLPLQTDKSEPVSNTPIFFGGINVYLQQKLALFRRTPRWIDRLFDWPAFLHWIGRKAEMTNAKDLAETTISMLRGEEGRQIKELDRLVEWLSIQENKPDIVCLSNILLAGLARGIKKKLAVPVVCLLQDEDGFLDGLSSPYKEQAWRILVERAGDIDVFISVSRYYANVMQKRLQLQTERLHVVYMGISPDGYELQKREPEVPTIGYLSRMCIDKGLDILVDAFIILKSNEKLQNLKMRIAGGKTGSDKEFINNISKKLTSCGLINDVEFLPDFDQDAKLTFLQSISVLSVPEKNPVAYGLYVLEALAAGVPVVEPAIGVFPEILEITGGGELFESNNASALAAALEPILLDPDYAKKLGKQGRSMIYEKFNVEKTAKEMIHIYENI